LKKSLAGRGAKNIRLLGDVARWCNGPQERKFFGSFFKKRTFLLLLSFSGLALAYLAFRGAKRSATMLILALLFRIGYRNEPGGLGQQAAYKLYAP
jgi:hypothetical protein